MRRLLVLWDVDYTLLDSGGTGRELYQIAFREMFSRDMPEPGSMAGRTDRAIAIEVLTLAGVPEPRRRVDAFHALMATRAPDLADLARERVRALPGAAQALAALRDGRAGPEVVHQATVLVGDTPFDVGAALATGARAVGVATGGFSAAELTASGAHAVLPDLADTDRVLAAILGPQGP